MVSSKSNEQQTFHAWLFGCLPADATTILSELKTSHRAKIIPPGFPKDAAELSEAMRELEAEGLVEKRESEWFWLSDEKVKVEPQGVLFA